MRYEHEIVKPSDSLPFWLILHPNYAAYVPVHWHQGIEINYTVRGTIDQFTIGNQQFRTQTGEILVVNSQVLHSVEALRNFENTTALSIIYPFDFVVGLYPNIKSQKIVINDYSKLSEQQQAVYHQLQGQLEQIVLLEQQSAKKLKTLNVMVLGLSVLATLLANFTVNSSVKLSQSAFITERSQKIIDYIQQNYQNTLTLQAIADDSHLSKEYLARFFKKNTGLTVGQYISNTRAQGAHADILARQGSLTAIAMSNGFSGIRSMNRALVRLYQQNASQIRQSM